MYKLLTFLALLVSAGLTSAMNGGDYDKCTTSCGMSPPERNVTPPRAPSPVQAPSDDKK